MIMRTVHIHQPFADRTQSGQSGGRTIDKLPVRSVGGKRALKDKLMVFTRFEALFRKEIFERRTKFVHVKYRFNTATFLTTPDQGAISAFTEDQVERAQND